MKKTAIFSALLATAGMLAAQVNMNTIFMESNPFLCQPGVVNKSPNKGASLSYGLNPDYKMLSPNAEKPSNVQRNERIEARLKFPVIMRPKLKVMLGLDYTLERYHFLRIEPDNFYLFKHLNETDLKNVGISVSIFRPINHKFYTSMRFSANWQGDYPTFISLHNRYAVYRFSGVFGVKKRENLEYGAGLLLNKGYRGNSVVPFAFYNQTFNEHWGVEAVLPNSLKLRYNFDKGQIAMLGTEFTSQNYALNVQMPAMLGTQNAEIYHFRRASFDVVGIFYQRFSKWIWLQLKAGYVLDNNSDARDLPRRLTHDLKPSGGAIALVSFFLSPPKQCLNKANTQFPNNGL